MPPIPERPDMTDEELAALVDEVKASLVADGITLPPDAEAFLADTIRRDLTPEAFHAALHAWLQRSRSTP